MYLVRRLLERVDGPRHLRQHFGSLGPNTDRFDGRVSLANRAATTVGDDSMLPADVDSDYAHRWFLITQTSARSAITGQVVIDIDTQPRASPNRDGLGVERSRSDQHPIEDETCATGIDRFSVTKERTMT